MDEVEYQAKISYLFHRRRFSCVKHPFTESGTICRACWLAHAENPGWAGCAGSVHECCLAG